jgi:tRNA(Arg) A34 adenosine deaminase TadA
MENNHTHFMREAIKLAIEGMEKGLGGPFGAVVVKDGVIIGRGSNNVLANNDPTAHAEVTAIREACKALKQFQLSDCIIYTSCEPCPMCLGAIYWARPKEVFFAGNRLDAANAGFDDDFIYREIDVPLENRQLRMTNILREESLKAFEIWKRNEDKTLY